MATELVRFHGLRLTHHTTHTGYISGATNRFNGNDDAGQDAWVADVETGETRRVGLVGAEFTGADGAFQVSHADRVSKDGLVTGRSLRFGASGEIGQAAWIANVNTGETNPHRAFRGG